MKSLYHQTLAQMHPDLPTTAYRVEATIPGLPNPWGIEHSHLENALATYAAWKQDGLRPTLYAVDLTTIFPRERTPMTIEDDRP